MSCRTGVALIGLSLSLLGCGASPWLKALQDAAKYQDETVEAQKAATDDLVKVGYLACNGWSVRYGSKAQAVLDARAEDARGVPGAAAKVSKAESDASRTEAFFTDYCALAKKVAAKFNVAPALSAPATPVPTGAVMPSPALGGTPPSAPVGAPIQPTPPVVVPVPAVPQ